MIYIILGVICATVGTPDWCIVVCAVMGALRITPFVWNFILAFLGVEEES